MLPLQVAPWGILEGGALLVGLLLAFAGYPLYRFALWFGGFLLGLAVGALLGPVLELQFLGSTSPLSALIALAFGVLGGWLAVALETVIVLVSGVVLGYLSTVLLAGVEPSNPIAVVVGLLAGVLAIKFYVWTIVLTTAFVGSWLVTAVWLLGSAPLEPSRSILVFLVVFLAGVLVQRSLHRRGVSSTRRRSNEVSRASTGPPERIRCPECGHLNGRTRSTCFTCGSPL